MQINEILTEKLDKNTLNNIINNNFSNIMFYGEYDNLLFLKKGNSSGILNLECENFIIPFTKGILQPILKNNKKCYRLLNPINNEFIYSWNDDHYNEKENGTSFTLKSDMYRDDYYCEYNLFNELGKKILNKKFLACCHNENCFKKANLMLMKIDNRNDYTFEYCKLDENFKEILPNEFLKMKKIKFKNDNFREKIITDKWQAMSDYKYGLSIIYNNGVYGVIDLNYNIVFNYDNNITYINILSPNTLILKNKDNKKALYSIEKGYITNFEDNIDFETINELSNNVFRLTTNNKHKLIIGNKTFEGEYNYIYFDEGVIILEQKNKTIFLDINGKLIKTINTNEFYKYNNNIYFKQKNAIYKIDLKTSEKTLIKSFIKTEDGKIINNNIDNILKKYNYYYFDEQNNELILFKEKKYGVKVDTGNNISTYKWFDKLKNSYIFEKLFLENLVNCIDNSNEISKQKVLTKK